jgi:hypothetical protein
MQGRPPKPSTQTKFTRRDDKRFKRAAMLREAGKLDEAEALDARAADKVIAREERTTRRIKTHGIRSVRRSGGFIKWLLDREKAQVAKEAEERRAAEQALLDSLDEQTKMLERRAAIAARADAIGYEIRTRGGGTRRTRRSGGDIVCHLLTIRNQIKLYHWQTKQFSRHKSTDDLTAALDTSIDNFVESYMGRYGRPTVTGSIKLHNFSESAAKSFVAKETKYLETDLPRTIGKTDSDLLNIRDEILAELTKVSYLFTLT